MFFFPRPFLLLVATQVALFCLQPLTGVVAASDKVTSRLADPLTIPFSQLGAEVQKQYSGDGIGISALGQEARLRVQFQQLTGKVSDEGLWLESTDAMTGGGCQFRVRATSVGRAQSQMKLAEKGQVKMSSELVSYIRSGLVEEYRVSTDGVRQDFVVMQAPEGIGELRVKLLVEGAKIALADSGVLLTLNGSGREIAYSRLKVVDAKGRELKARFSVAGPGDLEICVADADAVYPVRIDPTFSDADWFSMNGPQGPNSTVYASAVDSQGNLYLGGAFTQVGSLTVNYVAKWDGAAWSALGSGLSSEVRSLAVSGTTLYAGGPFSTAGGVSAPCIARWDGSAWSALGSGMNGSVTALLVSGSDLYASGAFTSAGGVSAVRVARWNGTVWNALGSGVGSPGSGLSESVRALAISGSTLFVGGTFSTAGGNSVANFAQWNGSSWSTLGDGFNSNVRALAVIGTSVYVGGDFGLSGAVPVNRIARWNGSSWVALGGGLNSAVLSLAVSGTDLYVGGGFSTADGVSASCIARWNGTAFSAVGSGVNSFVNTLAVHGGNVYAAGGLTMAGSVTTTRVGRWDGSSWHALAPGMNGLVRAVAVSGTDVYAGGSFTTAGGVQANYIAKWNGTSWSALGTGLDGPVNALFALGNTVYAGGEFTTAGGIPASNVAWWGGSSWISLGTGLNGAVQSLALFNGSLYAGGSFTGSSAIAAPFLAKYEGGVWNALPSSPNSTVNCLAATETHLYAGGFFSQVGSVPANHIARWDGSAWSALGSGTNASVGAVAASGADVYVSGEFLSAGGVAASRIAHWDGSTWHPLGSGTATAAVSLVVSGPYLYAGGNFVLSSVGAVCIAKWNGKVWRPLGSGGNALVSALAASPDGGHLYAGGAFTRMGDKDAGRIAHAVLPPEPEITVRGNFVDILNGDVTPDAADFTEFDFATVTGPQPTRTFTISNFSNAPLVVTGVTITGTHASDFTVTTPPASNVGASSSTTFTLSFAPTAGGLRTAVVNIANDDANEDPFTFAIQGQAGVPDIHLTGNGNAISNGANNPDVSNHTYFGATIPGSPVERVFTIGNSGNGELYASPVQIIGPHAADFSVVVQPSTIVYPSSANSFAIRFSPMGSGFRNATVSISSSDPDESPYTFDIRGRSYNFTPVAQPQTILFAPPAKVYLGQGEIPVQATSTSGLPVTLTVLSGPATLGNNTLTFTGGVGLVKIRASQEGNVFFKAAKPVDRIITIQEDPTTLTLANLVQTYTGTPRAITTLGAAGAVVTYNNDPLAQPPTQAGKYPVKAVAGGVTRTGMLTITKAPLTVIPDFQRKLVSQPNPVLTLAYQGLLGADTVEAVMSVAPVGKTTAKGTSPAGSYPITAAGGVSANYSFIYVKGTLLVEGFAGQYEALMTNEFGDATAKMEMNIAASNSTFTGKITSAVDAKTVPIIGGLTTSFASESTAGVGNGKLGNTTYQVTVNVPLEGDVTVSATRNALPLGSTTVGQKLLVLVKPATLSYTGAHTLRLAPSTGGAVMPGGAGYATAKINANGSLTLVGKLADGTPLTAALASDRAAGYRLFALPYQTRSGSYLAGKLNLLPHPDVLGRRYISQASGTLLLWAKAGKITDTAYRAGFGIDAGPLETQLTLDPWLPPIAAKGAIPGVTLSQRLGLGGASLDVFHGMIDSDSFSSLPTSVSLASNNAVTVQLPVTSPPNATGWKITLVPATGAFTGSFLLKDTVASKPISRTVKFSGVLRQPPIADVGSPVGSGHFILPALTGASSNEVLSGDVRFVKP